MPRKPSGVVLREWGECLKKKKKKVGGAWLAQSGSGTVDLEDVGSSPILGVEITQK